MELLKYLRAQWDRTAAIAAVIAGLLCLLFGFLGVRDTAYVAGQLPYFISGGLLGIFFLGMAGIAWLSADLRDEWRELRSLRGLIEGDVRRVNSQGSVAPGVRDESAARR